MDDYGAILRSLKEEGRLRTLNRSLPAQLLNCTDNDYMAIGRDGATMSDFIEDLGEEHGMGALASRLLMTRQAPYRDLEELLGSAYGKDVLLFNSGYHANTGCVAALAIPGTLILADRLVHASIIDGIILSKAPFIRFRHNDMAHLRSILAKEGKNYKHILVVTESIFSMDGDIAPLAALCELKKEFPQMILYVDEAHGFGVRGERGLGLCEETNLIAQIDIIIGTLGKAAASVGAFAVVSSVIKDFLLNTARSFIFSTALPPINIRWSQWAVNRLFGMKSRRDYLYGISKRLCRGIEELTSSPVGSDSQIVPMICGSSEKAIALSEALQRHGVLALPIRRPTVPPGTERIRFSLNAGMTEADIDHILNALKLSLNEI